MDYFILTYGGRTVSCEHKVDMAPVCLDVITLIIAALPRVLARCKARCPSFALAPQ